MKRRRAANLKLANPGLSHHSRRLKETNDWLVQELQRIKNGPLGARKWSGDRKNQS